MCRSIRPLYNYDPPVTAEEISAAARQYVRKVSGYRHPSKANEKVFDSAVREISEATSRLIETLVTSAPARNREDERKRQAAARSGRAPGAMRPFGSG